MCLLSGPAVDVDTKYSRMTGLFISQKKLCFRRQKKNCSMLYQVKANQNFVKNKSKTKQFPLTFYINCGQ